MALKRLRTHKNTWTAVLGICGSDDVPVRQQIFKNAKFGNWSVEKLHENISEGLTLHPLAVRLPLPHYQHPKITTTGKPRMSDILANIKTRFELIHRISVALVSWTISLAMTFSASSPKMMI